MHRLDVVIADSQLTPELNVRAFNHLLGQCDVTVFGTAAMAKKYAKGFPKSLDGAPMLLPTQNTALRRSLEQWFDAQDIQPDTLNTTANSRFRTARCIAGQRSQLLEYEEKRQADY